MHLPIRARLTLISTVMMAAVLVVVGFFIYSRLTADLTQALDAGLRSRAEQIVGALPRDGGLRSPGTVIEPDEAFAQIIARDGSIVDASEGVESAVLLEPEQAAAIDAPFTYEATVSMSQDMVPARLFAVPVDEGQIVVVGASLEDQQDALHRLAALSIVGGSIALLLSALVGWVVAGAALRPVERMRSEAAAISSAEPGRRLAIPATADELARLGETLNLMLQHLEEALERERRFVSDASHELRTPLANLKAELELAIRRPRDEADLREALRSAAEETDRLIQLAQDLLVLARADQGELPLSREPAQVTTLLDREASTFAVRAAQRGVTIQVDAPKDLVFNLDVLRFRQALSNLLDNAVRHSPAGATVTVTARISEQSLIVEVADAGEGFAVDYLPSAFEPFSRADVARTRSDGGSGLGLAIVRAVVQAHGGSVVAGNRPEGGGLVTLRVPA